MGASFDQYPRWGQSEIQFCGHSCSLILSCRGNRWHTLSGAIALVSLFSVCLRAIIHLLGQPGDLFLRSLLPLPSPFGGGGNLEGCNQSLLSGALAWAGRSLMRGRPSAGDINPTSNARDLTSFVQAGRHLAWCRRSFPQKCGIIKNKIDANIKPNHFCMPEQSRTDRQAQLA